MKYEILYAMNGEPVTRLWPENDADLAEIHRLATIGELDARESFGDDPELWEQLARQKQEDANSQLKNKQV